MQKSKKSLLPRSIPLCSGPPSYQRPKFTKSNKKIIMMCNIKKSRNLARKSRHWAIAEDVTGT